MPAAIVEVERLYAHGWREREPAPRPLAVTQLVVSVAEVRRESLTFDQEPERDHRDEHRHDGDKGENMWRLQRRSYLRHFGNEDWCALDHHGWKGSFRLAHLNELDAQNSGDKFG
jgi:hypothetical protein